MRAFGYTHYPLLFGLVEWERNVCSAIHVRSGKSSYVGRRYADIHLLRLDSECQFAFFVRILRVTLVWRWQWPSVCALVHVLDFGALCGVFPSLVSQTTFAILSILLVVFEGVCK